MPHHKLKYVLATAFALPLSQAAADIKGQVGVVLEVSKGCQVTQGSASSEGILNFGTLNFPRTSPTWTRALKARLAGPDGNSLQVTCDPVTTFFNVIIDGGLRGDRSLLNGSGSDTVSYLLYRDSAGKSPYVINRGATFRVPADGKAVDVPIYGTIAPNANAKGSGVYRDTLTLTLEF